MSEKSEANPDEDGPPPPKKQKIFSVSEFRKKIKTPERNQELQRFHSLCTKKNKDEFISFYLTKGGNCEEILQLFDYDDVSHVVVLQIFNELLMRIVADHPDLHTHAYEACRHFLNRHLSIANKIFQQSTVNKEKKVTLKLLSVMAVFSTNLAKDILQKMHFNVTNVEVLAKSHVSGKNEVRNAFAHFVVAFLVEGHPGIIALLLERKLLEFVLRGLYFDEADSVCLILSTLKKNILENGAVKKTSKMKVFNTMVIKDLVNLYNWKGPQGSAGAKKSAPLQIDPATKSQVNEAVHEFLLTLCTTKFGVIFRDASVGLDKHNHNTLVCTVLESLERPWEHSYASELVTKICGACPDLAKTVWANLQPSLAPTANTRWLSAIGYAKTLLTELQPGCIEYCARDFTAYQLAQITQILVVPTPILKVFLHEHNEPSAHTVKLYVYDLAVAFLKAAQAYMARADEWLTPTNAKIYKKLLADHIVRKFPMAGTLFANWHESISFPPLELLETIFNVIDLYEAIAPQLLANLDEIDVVELLDAVKSIEKSTKSTVIQMRAIYTWVKFDPMIFAPHSKLFLRVFVQALHYYHESKSPLGINILKRLLANTKLFEGCRAEIPIWINAIFDCAFDRRWAKALARIFIDADRCVFDLLEQMTSFIDDRCVTIDCKSIIQLSAIDATCERDGQRVRNVTLSPLVLGCFNCMRAELIDYFNCVLLNLLHAQTNTDLITKIILHDTHKEWTAKSVRRYVKNWRTNAHTPLPIDDFASDLFRVKHELNKALIECDSEVFLTNFAEKIGIYPGHELDLYNLLIAIVVRLLQLDQITDNHLNHALKLMKYLAVKSGDFSAFFSAIFTHPVLLASFTSLDASKNFGTQFLLDFINAMDDLNQKTLLENYLTPFRAKLMTILRKLARKPDKFQNILRIIKVIGLKYTECLNILHLYVNIDLELLTNSSVMYELLVFTLESLHTLCKDDMKLNPIDSNLCERLGAILQFLNEKQMESARFARVFHDYLMQFPHHIANVRDDVFKSVLMRNELCRENRGLVVHLLEKDVRFFDVFLLNVELIYEKKGLLLPLLDTAIIYHKIDEKTLKSIYNNMEATIKKALERPQKALKHFEYYRGVEMLIERFLPIDYCLTFAQKIQKFDVAEAFHAALLKKLYLRVIGACEANEREKFIAHALTTLFIIANGAAKQRDNLEMTENIAEKIYYLLRHLQKEKLNVSYRSVIEHDSFSKFCKFSLKFGVAGNPNFLKIIWTIGEIFDIREGEAEFLMEILISHSNFLEILLLEHDLSDCKRGVLGLFLVLCKKWPRLKRRNHVPLLLAAFQCTTSDVDLLTLELLQMYEKDTAFTNFYDFKPFLWGRAAANHYSIRQDAQTTLWRQPKPSNLLELLDEDRIVHTFHNYPLKLGLKIKCSQQYPHDGNSYNLSFLLPLFASILAPESPAPTNAFTRNGSLSLTLIALSSDDKEVRKAACLVLARLHHHLEGLKGGKDKLIWLGFTEFVCRGAALLDDVKINNFVAVFCARMARILSRPLHILYTPLTQFLSAKPAPDFATIPELHVLLHSADVNYVEQRQFILEVVRDGLRTDDDLKVAARAMTFKFIMDLYDAECADVEVKLLILEIVERALRVASGIAYLCNYYGLIAWLCEICAHVRAETTGNSLLVKIVHILTLLFNATSIEHSILVGIVRDFIARNVAQVMEPSTFDEFLLIIDKLIVTNDERVMDESGLRQLIKISDDPYCNYLLEYKYDRENAINSPLRALTIRWITKNKIY